MLAFRYVDVPDWPPLAWVARCRRDSPEVAVFHGPRVETASEWFCEAVWAGQYEEGGFDQTSLVAGSGGRRRDHGICFVSSGSTVDRLCAVERDGRTWVSNTLPGLLAMVDGYPVRSHPRYLEDFATLQGGIQHYKRYLATSAGPVELIYFDNLRWDGRTLTREPKPPEPVKLSAFDVYRRFLASSLAAVARNMAAGERRHPYSMLGTLSRGYDSPTVMVLAREAGCQEAITLTRARTGEDDSGDVIGSILGIRIISIDRGNWRTLDMPEVAFFAGDAAGEDIILAPAVPLLANRVFLTGFQGDMVWKIHKTEPGPHIERGDNSGLSFTEVRLSASFIHLPLPFWGARRIAEINAISLSDEMRPWRLGNTYYDRPICRRIVEEAGVPRELFGTSKKAASVNLRSFPEFLTERSLVDYLAWLRQHRRDWPNHGRIPPIVNWRWDLLLRRSATFLAEIAMRVRSRAARISGMSWLARHPALRWVIELKARPLFLRRYVFAWAVERATARYPRPASIEPEMQPLASARSA